MEVFNFQEKQNRVEEINELSKTKWKYCRGKNPADYLSTRGVKAHFGF